MGLPSGPMVTEHFYVGLIEPKGELIGVLENLL